MRVRLALIAGVLVCTTLVQEVFAQSQGELVSQLRADFTVLTDARVEFEQLEYSANSSPAEQADFAEWILQLSRQVAQSCRMLMYSSEQAVPADIPCDEYTLSYQAPVAIDINGETTDSERTAVVVDRFNASLGNFDEKLLREQDRVKARKAQTSSAGGSGGGADGAGEGASAAEGAEGSKNGAGEAGQSGEQSSGQEGQQGDETGTSNNNNNSSSGSPSGGKPSSAPPGTPDGRNDDVIARQLREAAEKETDPELKRKLWAEYRRYKQDSP